MREHQKSWREYVFKQKRWSVERFFVVLFLIYPNWMTKWGLFLNCNRPTVHTFFWIGVAVLWFSWSKKLLTLYLTSSNEIFNQWTLHLTLVHKLCLKSDRTVCAVTVMRKRGLNILISSRMISCWNITVHLASVAFDIFLFTPLFQVILQ